MLMVDTRAGSKELIPLLRARGLPVVATRLEYGDIAFLGIGPDGVPVPVGIEYKSIHDVLQCICTGRFAGHQLPGLVKAYQQIWLLIGGEWRARAKDGMLQYHRKRGEWEVCSVGQRTFMFRDLLTWLFTMSTKGGISVARVSNWNEATIWLSTLFAWWTNKGWNGHQSHLVFHDGSRFGFNYRRERAAQMVRPLADRALLTRPSLARMVAAQLPHIGWEKSKAIVARYPTVEQLCQAEVEELEELDGIGKKIAGDIYASLRSAK